MSQKKPQNSCQNVTGKFQKWVQTFVCPFFVRMIYKPLGKKMGRMQKPDLIFFTFSEVQQFEVFVKEFVYRPISPLSVLGLMTGL